MLRGFRGPRLPPLESTSPFIRRIDWSGLLCDRSYPPLLFHARLPPTEVLGRAPWRYQDTLCRVPPWTIPVAFLTAARANRFAPTIAPHVSSLAIQFCCCASAVELSYAQSAFLISLSLSELLQSADIHPHICIIARRPLYLPINIVVCVVVEGNRQVSFGYYYNYFTILATQTHHLAFAISLHRSISTFPFPHMTFPAKHTPPFLIRPPPPEPHSS